MTGKCASSLSHGTSHSLSEVAKVQHLSMLFLWHSTQELPIDGVLATEIDKAALRPDLQAHRALVLFTVAAATAGDAVFVRLCAITA